MIDQEVEKLAKNFIDKFRNISEKSKDYNFDLSYYSINLLDFALDSRFSHINKDLLDELFLESASYLGLCIYGIWENITPSPVLSLFLKEHPKKEIIINFKSEVFTKEGEVVFNLSEILKNTVNLKNAPYFPTRESIILPGEERRGVSHTAFGIVTGLSNEVIGPWKYKTESELSLLINQVSNLVGEERSQKLESISSHIPEKDLVIKNLTLPPIGFKEELQGKRITSFISKNLEVEDLKWMSSLFNRSDFLLSCTGYLFNASLDNINYINKAKDFSLVYPLRASALRPMFNFIREKKGFLTWSTLSTQSRFDEALLELRIESEYGLVPLINTISLADALNPKNILFYEALASGLIKEGYIIGRKIISKKTADQSILFNQAFICYKLEKLEEAEEILKRIDNKFIEKVKLNFLLNKKFENLDLDSLLNSYNPNCWQFEAEFFISLFNNLIKDERYVNILKGSSCPVLEYSSELNYITQESKIKNSWSPFYFWGKD